MINLIKKFFSLLILKQESISDIYNELSSSNRFDRRYFDKKIANLVKHIKVKKKKVDSHKIAFLTTSLFDRGGQAKCLISLSGELSKSYKQALFITSRKKNEHDAPKTMKILKRYMSVVAVDFSLSNFQNDLIFVVNKIVAFSPKVLIVTMNPHDIFATAILALIRKNTNIKILYFNQASHWPLLGLSFSHFIIEASPLTAQITIGKRHMNNCKIIPLASLRKDETTYYTQTRIKALKKRLHIPLDAFVSLSGGSAYKFFDTLHTSIYFCMIRNLLNREKKLYHVVMSDFQPLHIQTINEIFKNSAKLKNRLIFIPRQNDFDIYFQMADVFIDSFPVSSALTQMDLMRNKVASVVKINNQNPMHSFHEYQMPGYPYMYSKVADMEEGILTLLHDKKARQDIIEKNYRYWLNKYEASVVAKKYMKLIEEL